ncbi:MAG: LptF/LptG family permease [Spirochaetota bacterium]|nr:LptF/LptG family permease [Spirochaetota bacterium]
MARQGHDLLRRFRYRRLSFYLAYEYLISFLVAFFFFFAIFFVNQLLLLAEEILSKDVAATDVMLLIVYSLPAIISFTFPFASLVGGLMAVSRFSSDNEILALRASGIPYRRIIAPFLAAGLLFSLVSFIMGDYFLPRGTISFGRLYRKILYSNPALELEPFSVREYQDTILVTGDINGGTIRDLVIIDTTDDGDRRIILAETAELRENIDQRGVVGLTLSDVFGHIMPPKRRGSHSYFSAEEMIYNILLRDINLSFSSLTPREMSSVDIYREIQQKKAALMERRGEHLRNSSGSAHTILQEYYQRSLGPGRTSEGITDLSERFKAYTQMKDQDFISRSLRIHQLELYKKVAIPFGCFAFVFFFFPAGTFSRKSGRSMGFGIGLIVSVLYWALLFGGQTMGLRMNVSPAAAMWLPNIVVIGVGLVLYRIRMSR